MENSNSLIDHGKQAKPSANSLMALVNSYVAERMAIERAPSCISIDQLQAIRLRAVASEEKLMASMVFALGERAVNEPAEETQGSQSPVAIFYGRRHTPEGTHEVWGYMLTGAEILPGAQLFIGVPR